MALTLPTIYLSSLSNQQKATVGERLMETLQQTTGINTEQRVSGFIIYKVYNFLYLHLISININLI